MFLFQRILYFFSFVLLLILSVNLFDHRIFYFELVSHFVVFYLAVALVFAVCGYLGGYRKVILGNFFSIIICLYQLYPYLRLGKFTSEQGNFKVIEINVDRWNKNKEQATAEIIKLNADFLVLLEINNDWLPLIPKFQEQYPYSFVRERDDKYGIAIFSKKEFLEPEVIFSNLSPMYVSKLKINPQKEINFVTVHALATTSFSSYQQRNQLFDDLRNILEKQSGLKLVLGDFNISPWSPVYKDFIEKTKLLDLRKNRAIFPTWPSSIPFFSIPIDHIFLSSNSSAYNLVSFPLIGSDHKGLMLEFEFANRPD